MKQQLKLHKIKSNPNNPRIIKNDRFKKLVHSIINSPGFMELRPVIIDVDFMVIGGNMRLKAHHHLNRKEVWTDMFTQEMSDKMNVLALEEGRKTQTYLEYCQAFTIKDNVSSGEWEWDILANEWDSVQLAEWGLDVWENQDDVKEGLIEDDEIPEVKESIVKRGDIWQLGEHRVMCGDSTSSDDVAKLMNGEKADMVFTDPPYNVAYGSSKNPIWGSKWNGSSKDGVIINDNKTEEGWRAFCVDIATTLHQITDGPIYACHAPGPDGMKMTLAFVDCKIHWSSTIILYKDRLVPGRSDYQKRYEACFYGWCEGDKIKHLKDRTQTDVWEYKRPSVNDLHPTMKPLELIERAIKDHKHIKTIADIFLGSGSTLIAAEKLNRKCYGMELDEKYCDVIIERWEQFTGLKAIHEKWIPSKYN
jgi:DNA modification methylase